MTEEQSAFKRELSLAIKDYFEQQKNGRYATAGAWLKATLLFLSFFLLYGAILLGDLSSGFRLGLVVIWGLNALLLVFNVGHDAVHNAFSRSAWVNKLLGYSFNLVGANAYSWQLKHNEAHHRHTNVEGMDHDTEMDPFLRVSPHAPSRWYYKWQHLYWPFIYGLLSILIIFVADFLIFFQERKPGKLFFQPIREWVILIITKAFYLFYIFFVPIQYAGFSPGEVFIAFFLYHFVNGLVIGLVFQPSHYFLGTNFFNREEEPAHSSWLLHQMMTTLDISPDNRVLSQLLGSLNANVAHHMYPKVCHVHYPNLSAIIQELSQQHQVPYHRKSYPQALRSHVGLLRKMSVSNIH